MRLRANRSEGGQLGPSVLGWEHLWGPGLHSDKRMDSEWQCPSIGLHTELASGVHLGLGVERERMIFLFSLASVLLEFFFFKPHHLLFLKQNRKDLFCFFL